MSDQYLVRHCAPTLAGLKTGSLFTCPYGCQEQEDVCGSIENPAC